MTVVIRQESQKPETSELIELYTLDLTSLGDSVYHFTPNDINFRNLALYSQDLGGAAWTNAAVAETSNAAVAPDGTTTADKIAPDGTTGNHTTYQSVTTTSGTTYTQSFYIKAAGWNQLVRLTGVGGPNTVIIDFSTATPTVVSGVALIVPDRQGYFRISWTDVAASTGSQQVLKFRFRTSGNSESFAGDSTSGFYVWGCQIEASSSVSDLQTTGSVLGNAIIWQGNTYTPFDMQASGFEMDGKGSAPQPKISFSVTNQVLTSLINSLGDLIGAKITRCKTYRKFLDTELTANSSAYYPLDIYRVERKSSENRFQVEFELSSIMDQRGATLPARTITAFYCPWIYRRYNGGVSGNPLADFTYYPADNACPHQGTGYFDLTNTATTAANDKCAKTQEACKARFGATALLPFGGFPGASRPVLQ